MMKHKTSKVAAISPVPTELEQELSLAVNQIITSLAHIKLNLKAGSLYFKYDRQDQLNLIYCAGLTVNPLNS